MRRLDTTIYKKTSYNNNELHDTYVIENNLRAFILFLKRAGNFIMKSEFFLMSEYHKNFYTMHCANLLPNLPFYILSIIFTLSLRDRSTLSFRLEILNFQHKM